MSTSDVPTSINSQQSQLIHLSSAMTRLRPVGSVNTLRSCGEKGAFEEKIIWTLLPSPKTEAGVPTPLWVPVRWRWPATFHYLTSSLKDIWSPARAGKQTKWAEVRSGCSLLNTRSLCYRKGRNGHNGWTEISWIWDNGAKAVYPGGKTTLKQRRLSINSRLTPMFKQQKRHAAKNEDEGGWGGEAVYRQWRSRETKHFVWEIRETERKRTRDEGRWVETVFRECSLHLGFSFVYSSEPRSSPSLWVLAGNYILGSGQRDWGVGGGGGGALETQASPPVGPQHRHYPTPKRLKRETVQT